MSRRSLSVLVGLCVWVWLAVVREPWARGQVEHSPADAVHVMIGTGGEGQTFPATGVPFAMTQWTPQTREGEGKCVAPYYAGDTRIQGFRGSHFLSGSCAQDYGSFTVMPLATTARLDAMGRSSAFSRQSEVARPYVYSVSLADSGIHAEITGTQRSGMMRFRFAEGARTGWIAVENNLRLGHGSVHIDVEKQEITGENPVYRIYAGAGQAAGFSGYVVVRFDRRFTVGGTWCGSGSGSGRRDGSIDQVAEGSPAGAFVRFELPADGTVQVRIGTSFSSLEEARKNLAAEIPGWEFDGTVASARRAWDEALSAVVVPEEAADRAVFYTALYHSMLTPRTFSDRSGTYPRFAGGGATERADGFTYYCDYSIWDTFRAVHPLFALLDRDRDRDMVRSLIAKGEQGGFLPIFPAWNSYTTEMTGDYAGAIIADAYVKGIRGFDAEAAYRLMRRNAMEEPADAELYRRGRGRRALDSYLRYGYVPLEDHVPYAFHPDEQVSRTLDYAYNDFVAGVMASALGHADDAALFAKRAGNWRNVFDGEGFARGRHADGSWVTPFDPSEKASYVTESTPFVDSFFVLHDIPGLMERVGGQKAFVARLDELFARKLYDHGNEPSHHIAYLYDDAGAAWKTQQRVHDIVGTLYKDAPDGLPGNDDGGQMSAWYVFSALGFYPVTPGTARYSVGTPRFDAVTVRVGEGRTLRILAPGAEAGRFYVKSVKLNGRVLNRRYLLHSELAAGGELVFEMSDRPETGRAGGELAGSWAELP
jgi:predicted alpha-1,2-mannosidase